MKTVTFEFKVEITVRMEDDATIPQPAVMLVRDLRDLTRGDDAFTDTATLQGTVQQVDVTFMDTDTRRETDE